MRFTAFQATVRCSVALLALASGCVSPATAVVVTVDTNIPQGRPIELTVRVAESETSAATENQQWSRGVSSRPDTLSFPSSFTVSPKAGGPRSGSAVVWFDVNALPWAGSADTLRFTRRVRFTFTPGQVTRIPVYLAAECGAQASDCPPSSPRCTIADRCEARGLTCGEGGRCVSSVVNSVPFDRDAQFAPVDAETPSMDAAIVDASMDAAAAMDASEPDASSAPDASGPETSTPDVFVPPGCTPECTGRVCGDNGCGGTCGSCAPRPNMPSTCNAAGQCQYACATGFGDCDGNAANGCESALDTASNCGMCARACSGAMPICSGGACGTGCAPGETRCGMTCVNTQNSESNCGACGRTCSLPNASSTCTAGACAIASCNAGFANCDGNTANGCETPLGTAANCNACGNACSGGTPNCNSMRVCVSGCGAGETLCGMSCVNTTSSTSHCGSCGNACPARANATVSCSSSACRFTCNAGFGDCDGNAMNGCETSLDSTSHCGMCGRACSFANGAAACTAGACALSSCTAGFGNCDGMPANGCETALNSTSHCGMCGRTCSVSNGSATCASGSCQVASCGAGFGNCDGNATNGCETNTTNNASHCSACANACPGRANASSFCSSSACGFSCSGGFGDCNSNGADGCEVNTTNNVSHCGGCGQPCAARANSTVSCSGSSCSYACQAGFADCDGMPANGCETALNSLANCGGCGVACSRPNATATCASGSCAIASCNAGFGNCDGNAANGCETNLNTNGNCGGCGVTCTGAKSCIGGFCQCGGYTGCNSPRSCCEGNDDTCACMICVCSTCACP